MTQISHAAAPMPAAPAVARAPAPKLVQQAPPAQPQSPPVETRTAARQEQVHLRARSHSRLVTALKWAFPVTVVGVVAVFVISVAANLDPNIELTMDSSLIEDGRVVMKNPKMKGVDKQNRPFEVIATRAMTDLTNPAAVELEGIDAKVPINATTFADVKADQGFYNNTEEVLLLRNNVRMSGARGMDIRMEDARINMKNGTLASDKPVTVKSDRTNISANAISVEDNGAKIVFTDRVRMTITQPVERGKKQSAAAQSSASGSTTGATNEANQ